MADTLAPTDHDGQPVSVELARAYLLAAEQDSARRQAMKIHPAGKGLR